MRLQTVGIRGLVDELIAALDSTLSRSSSSPRPSPGSSSTWGSSSRRGFWTGWSSRNRGCRSPWGRFAILVLSVLNAVLARLTHQELSTLRPARLRQAVGVAGAAAPAFLANAIIAGAALGFLFLMTRVPGWAESASPTPAWGNDPRGPVHPILVVVMLLSVVAWLLVGMCWLLTPAIVVEEEGSWLAGIREWRHLVQEHFSRIIFYEGLTVLLGIAISLPLVLAVSLALRAHLKCCPSPVPTGGTSWVTARRTPYCTAWPWPRCWP